MSKKLSAINTIAAESKHKIFGLFGADVYVMESNDILSSFNSSSLKFWEWIGIFSNFNF